MRNWLAAGPAASGTIIDDGEGRGFRYTIPPDLDAWLAAEGCGFFPESKFPPLIENLDTVTLIKETLLMGFRCIEGPDETLFYKRFHRNIEDLIPRTVSVWRNRGLFRHNKTALTSDELLFLNRFLIEAYKELDGLFFP
jgi:oxygen-independent coproporphyrinogen-3 oxidase